LAVEAVTNLPTEAAEMAVGRDILKHYQVDVRRRSEADEKAAEEVTSRSVATSLRAVATGRGE
jgi:hypothetical protein